MSEKPLHGQVAEALGWTDIKSSMETKGVWTTGPSGPMLADAQVEVWTGQEPETMRTGTIPRYDEEWLYGGPLLEKHKISAFFDGEPDNRWTTTVSGEWKSCPHCEQLHLENWHGYGETLLVAACELILALGKAGRL